MATKQEIQKRQQAILLRLEEGPASIQELMKISETQERTLLTDIKKLRDAGNKIKLENDIVTLLEKQGVAEHSSQAAARQAAVILLLSENQELNKEEPGLNKEEIVEELATDKFEMNFKEEEDYRLAEEPDDANDIRKATVIKNLESDLEKLLAQGMIQQKNGRYYISITMNSVSKYRDLLLLSIHKKIMTSGENSPYSSVLYVIAEKIADLMRYRLYDDENLQEKVCSLPIRDNKAKIDNYRETAIKLLRLPFKEKKLHIKWKTKKEELLEITLSVERIVYSCESGKMHLIGVSDNARNIWDKTPIDIADITEVETTDLENKIYNNKRINEILAESVVIDTKEPPHTIEVEFDNTEEIEEKVEQIVSTRLDTAKKEIRGNKIIYTDTIRGVRDITKILRKFGSSCRITEDSYKHSQTPSKNLDLKRIMYESAKGTIERYSNGEDK
ncbi:hypothetical protein J5690_00555 [bacterium]|nr:hypothetical protein [bacterium]